MENLLSAEAYLAHNYELLKIFPELPLKIVRELISKATTIVNAGDPDRGATC